MGTELLGSDYSNASKMVLQFIKDAEEKSLSEHMSGMKKKEFVIELIKENLPQFYTEHSLFIDVFIDTAVLVSNNPSVIKAEKKCILLCCKR